MSFKLQFPLPYRAKELKSLKDTNVGRVHALALHFPDVSLQEDAVTWFKMSVTGFLVVIGCVCFRQVVDSCCMSPCFREMVQSNTWKSFSCTSYNLFVFFFLKSHIKLIKDVHYVQEPADKEMMASHLAPQSHERVDLRGTT